MDIDFDRTIGVATDGLRLATKRLEQASEMHRRGKVAHTRNELLSTRHLLRDISVHIADLEDLCGVSK